MAGPGPYETDEGFRIIRIALGHPLSALSVENLVRIHRAWSSRWDLVSNCTPTLPEIQALKWALPSCWGSFTKRHVYLLGNVKY